MAKRQQLINLNAFGYSFSYALCLSVYFWKFKSWNVKGKNELKNISIIWRYSSPFQEQYQNLKS